MKENKKVTEYINKTSPEKKELLNALRRLIHKAIPETTEDVKWGIPVFTKTTIFTYLRNAKNHVALGVYNIHKIDDPNGLLEGTGKNMKHLKIRNAADINEELIIAWLKATAE